MRIKTDANNSTYYFEDGEPVYPCRCGSEHRGDYAIEDRNQHECLHDSPLLLVADNQAICGDCGKSWLVEDKKV